MPSLFQLFGWKLPHIPQLGRQLIAGDVRAHFCIAMSIRSKEMIGGTNHGSSCHEGWAMAAARLAKDLVRDSRQASTPQRTFHFVSTSHHVT